MAVPRAHQSSTRCWPRASMSKSASSTKKLTRSFLFSLTAETRGVLQQSFHNFRSRFGRSLSSSQTVSAVGFLFSMRMQIRWIKSISSVFGTDRLAPQPILWYFLEYTLILFDVFFRYSFACSLIPSGVFFDTLSCVLWYSLVCSLILFRVFFDTKVYFDTFKYSWYSLKYTVLKKILYLILMYIYFLKYAWILLSALLFILKYTWIFFKVYYI